MDISLVTSLQHLTCSRLVTSLFSHLEVQKNFRMKNYEMIRSQVNDAISRLIPCTRLKEKLERLIDPLFREIEDWLNNFEQSWYGYDSVLRAVLESIPRCWLSDGTIDREKSARALVENKDMRPINRFVFACTYCFFDDAVQLWSILFKIEKAYLKHKSTSVVKLWVEWLESTSVKDWEVFLAWALGKPLWHSNLFILKNALQALSPAERSRYLFDALIGKEVSNDIVRFCLSVMTKDEQEQIFRQLPVKILNCMLSWPLRTIFFEMADTLWPYLTEQSFSNFINATLITIKNQEREDMELLVILKNFWDRSPSHFQNVVKNDPNVFKPLQVILNCEVSQAFPKQEFGDSFWQFAPHLMPRPQVVTRRRRRRQVLRRYRDLR